MVVVSPLREGFTSGAVVSGSAPRPLPSLLHQEFASLTVFITLPGRFADVDMPSWGWKYVNEQLNTLRLQMDCKWGVSPHVVWSQLCTNGDVEVMVAAYTQPRSMRKAAFARATERSACGEPIVEAESRTLWDF